MKICCSLTNFNTSGLYVDVRSHSFFFAIIMLNTGSRFIFKQDLLLLGQDHEQYQSDGLKGLLSSHT